MSSNKIYAASTAETQYIETKSARFAYRRLGPVGGVPLLLLHRFRATLDWWDPRFIQALAAERDVILFDNIGIGYTEGEPLRTVDAFADGAGEVIEALGLSQVDLLGWSFGGVVAQRLAVLHPERVRRIVIAGSGSGAAPGMPGIPERVLAIQQQPESSLEDVLYLFYPETEEARARGLDHFGRVQADMPEGAPQVTQEAAMGQLEAIMATMSRPWDDVVSDLKEITAPVLYAGGAHDVMIDAFGSYAAVQVLPNAKLVLYSDAGHAFLFQHLDEFVREVLVFLTD
ncbi:alpha/beta hydrolase [Arthrobacter sp. ISL-48]|uniref:alpha/beta fold hydrolase n=1 Tax=Arthrobacter sp. ISL-48 TaxID=2819110 RepID=UPI001BEB544A|nr:alpha/beta hydrolase [Arthrobacter sp. ISL-48]MBT2534421.1 alpha/beta hydrolase [Arthrobacter sp. ISL-48]